MSALTLITKQLNGTVDELIYAYMKNITNDTKFECLSLFYLTNPFLTSAQKHNGLMFFSKIQKTYWAFKSLLYQWKIYKARKNINTEDLCMNQLSSISEKHKIALLDKNTIYEFRLKDLLRICCAALTFSHDLQPKAQWPKNPYTGIPLTKTHLYAMYFKLLDTNITIPYYIHLFFRWNFSLPTFNFELYPFLKDLAIKNYLLDSSDDTMLFEIEHMVHDLCKDQYFMNTDHMTSSKKEKTLRLFKPHLENYLFGLYSNNVIKKRKHLRQARKGLQDFFREHPNFGRRIVRARRSI